LFWPLLVGWFERSETQRSLAIVGFGDFVPQLIEKLIEKLIGNRFLSDSESQPTNTIFWDKVILFYKDQDIKMSKFAGNQPPQSVLNGRKP
jgi:hypothetical protein